MLVLTGGASHASKPSTRNHHIRLPKKKKKKFQKYTLIKACYRG